MLPRSIELDHLTKRDVSNLSTASRLDSRHAVQLQRGVVAEDDLRGILDGAPSRIDELLDEDLAEHAVRLLAEDGAEDDGDAVVAGLDVDGLLVAVVDGHNIPALFDTLGRLLAGVLGRLVPELVVLLVSVLEGGGHGVALHEGNLHDEVVALLLLGGEILQVDDNGEVIAVLGSHDIGAVLALQDLLGAILNELLEAADLNRDEDLGLGFGGRNVEGDAIKVGDGLVNGCRRCSVRVGCQSGLPLGVAASWVEGCVTLRISR